MQLLLVWPANGRAVDAYAYFALLEAYEASQVCRLSGWTQKNSKLKPLTSMLVDRDHRLLNSRCLKCGGDHGAKDCKAEVRGRDCKCGVCHAKVRIANRGVSITTPSVDPARTRGMGSDIAAAASVPKQCPPP